MKAFGPKHASDAIELCEVPVGVMCLLCEEAILEGDQGFVMPFVDLNGEREIAQHRECFLRSIFGSVGHQKGTCSCHGGTEEDPPGMTVRQAAKAAVDLMMEKK